MNSQPVESACLAFRQAWSLGETPNIAPFLADIPETERTATLVTLVELDMELRVQSYSSSGATSTRILSVDEYVAKFRELDDKEIRARLTNSLRALEPYDEGLETQIESEEEAKSDASPWQYVRETERYNSLGEFARGGMGVIWQVQDKKLGRIVAQKKLAAEDTAGPGEQERFIREARITAQLEHPGIVPIYDLSELEPGKPSYTMKLLKGETLTAVIRKFHETEALSSQSVEFSRLVNAFVSVCRTLAYAHSKKVLHRDLKPDNILLGEFGEIAVLDWGLAKSLVSTDDDDSSIPGEELSPTSPITDSSKTQLGTMLGTPAYMPPEQASGKPATYASDIYSLGAVLYQILTGRPPHNGTNWKSVIHSALHETPDKPSSLGRRVPLSLEAICLKALQKSPQDRYGSVTELTDDLERFLADEPVSCRREKTTEKLYRWMRNHRQQVVLATAALLLVAISSVAFALVNDARKSRQFAVQQRLQQLQASAETAEAVAQERAFGNAFADCATILEQAVNQIGSTAELSALKKRLSAKQARAEALAAYQQHYSQLYHLFLTSELDTAYRCANNCLESLGIENPEHDWASRLPDQDLTDKQKTRLREEIHGVLLQVSATHAMAGITEYTRKNANANYLTIGTNDRIKSKINRCRRLLDRADSYRKTTAARYLRLMMKLAADDITVLEFFAEWVTLEPEEPTSAVDCYFAAVIYAMSEDIQNELAGIAEVAKALGSKSKLTETATEIPRLLQKALRIQPDYYPAIYQLGMLHSKAGNFKAAHESFNACLRLAPDAPEAYTGRAMALLVQATVEEGTPNEELLRIQMNLDIQKAIELAPQNGHILKEVGALYCFGGKLTDAVDMLMAGLDLDPLRFLDQNQYNTNERDAMINNVRVNNDLATEQSQIAVYEAAVYLDFGSPETAWERLQSTELSETKQQVAQVLKSQIICDLSSKTPKPLDEFEAELTEDQFLSWTAEALKAQPNYYRAHRARICSLRLLGKTKQLREAVDTAIRHSEHFKDWQKFELLWFKRQLLIESGETAKSETVAESAREVSELYYERFAGIDLLTAK